MYIIVIYDFRSTTKICLVVKMFNAGVSTHSCVIFDV
jgi:hypothetical protein